MSVGSVIGRVIACLAAVAVVAFGLQVVGEHDATDSELLAESHQRMDDYVPVCGDEPMRPGDICAQWGAERGLPGTYQEMIDSYERWVSPTSLAAGDRTWRIVGYALAGLGGLLLVPTLLGFTAPARTRRARAALAEANGWTYRAEDPTLFDRWVLPDVRPRGRAPVGVLTGTHRGFPFALFDYHQVGAGRRTAVALQLPEAVPHLVVRAAGGPEVDPASSAAGRALVSAHVAGEFSRHRVGWFAMAGTTMVFHLKITDGPTGAAVLRRLDAGVELAGLLVGATR
ncbi:MAG TPA: hypothetical protein VEZ42_03990 [Pseudonocardia sp.]|nr:hypothetical protein [Pseudonocardia sp.]